jgi:Cu/Zn superoxide dismutase
VVHIGKYPGSTATTSPAGTLEVKHVDGANLLQITGVITGLEPGLTGGWHIHTGYTCTVEAGEDPNWHVGGHYYPTMAIDPWFDVRYTADSRGVFQASLTIKDFSLTGLHPVMGRAIVIHDAGGVRVGCGLIEPSFGEIVHFGPYPGYAGSSLVRGMLVASMQASGALTFKGTITGLASTSTGGWHVHTGASCSSQVAYTKYAVGGHYYPGMATDPWNAIQYSADINGVAQIDSSLAGLSLYESNPVVGHAVVVHDPASQAAARAGCGLLGGPDFGLATFGAYPGNNGAEANKIGGTLRVTYDEPTQVLTIDGLITGLTAGAKGGWHVHEGFSCSIESGEVANTVVGGHYWEGSAATPPTEDPWKPMGKAPAPPTRRGTRTRRTTRPKPGLPAPARTHARARTHGTHAHTHTHAPHVCARSLRDPSRLREREHPCRRDPTPLTVVAAPTRRPSPSVASCFAPVCLLRGARSVRGGRSGRGQDSRECGRVLAHRPGGAARPGPRDRHPQRRGGGRARRVRHH